MRAFAAKPLMFIQNAADILLTIETLIAIAAATAIASGFLLNLKRRHWVVRVRIARWAHVYLYAALGAMVFVLGAPWIRAKLTTSFNDGSLPTDGSLALTIAMAVLFVAMLRARPVAIGQLRNTLFFPPWWVAVLLAQAFVGAYWCVYPSTFSALMPGDYRPLGPSIVALSTQLLTCLLVIGLITWDRFRERGRSASRQTTSSDQKDWLASDEPIRCADDDLFGHTAIAKRIADRLSAPGEPSAIAVIGRFGSGKSSVRYLACEQLNKTSPWVVVVHLSAWPYESATALVAGILERVVAELANKAGWEALRHVPAAYREAVEGSAGSWGKLLGILERPRTPEDLLREIDDVALALGVRIVVWVEDLERFAPVKEDGLETPAVREKLEPVRALLHQLQELRHVTIVVATTRLDAGFDLEKLAQFIEVLPSLPHDLVLRKLDEARSEAMALGTSRGLIDPVPPGRRAKFALQGNSLKSVPWLARPTPVVWADALVTLSPTPRAIKQGVRDFLAVWTETQGEIDVDHVLGASILRHSEPQVFQALVSRADILRWSQEPQKCCLEFIEQLNVSPERREALIVVLQHLFGADSKEHLQGFGKIEPADYWARFLSRTSIAKADSDQGVLQALQLFAADGSGSLVETLMAPTGREATGWGSQIRAFESLLPTPKILDLLEAQLRWIHGLARPSEDLRLRLIDTWAICVGRAEAESSSWPADNLFAIIDEHIQMSVRSHDLQLAHCLLYWFGTPTSNNVAELLSSQHRRKLRRTFAKAFVETFGDDPNALAKALKDAEPWLLYRLCYGSEQLREHAAKQKFAKWPKLAKTLEAAARLHPREILPQIARFLTRTSHLGNLLETTVDHDAVNRLFPDADILSLYAQFPEVEAFDSETHARLFALRAEAHRLDAEVPRSG